MNENPAFQEDRDSIDISEYLWLLFHNKWIVLGFLVVSVAASVWITRRTRPVYRSSTTFMYNFTQQYESDPEHVQRNSGSKWIPCATTRYS